MASNISTTAVGCGRVGFATLEYLQSKGEDSISLVYYDTARKMYTLFSGSTEEVNSGAVPSRPDLSPPNRAVFYMLDADEFTDFTAIRTHAGRQRGLGSLTIAVATTSLIENGHSEEKKAGAVLKTLAKATDSVIILFNKGNSTASHEALATVIEFLGSIITDKLSQKGSVDFEDLRFVLQETGFAMAGVAEAAGPERAAKVVRDATSLPFMVSHLIPSSPKLLMNVTSGRAGELEMEELTAMTESVQEHFGDKVELIFGYAIDDTLGDKIKLQLVVPLSNNFLRNLY